MALWNLPTSRATKIAAQPFRLLLCRRLRLPSPFSVPADVAANSTYLATIVQRAHRLVLGRGGVSPSSALQHRCAGRQ